MQRVLESERIDQLPAASLEAIASRRDLLRLNRIMGHAGAMRHWLRAAHRAGARTLADLGAGDGRFLLHVARQLAEENVCFDGLLLDRVSAIEPETVEQFRRIGWRMEPVARDAIEWLDEAPAGGVDVLMSTLFLHHFTDDQLVRLFKRASSGARWLIACEPRRSTLAHLLAKCVVLIGCNSVTRHDAPVSVRAGFAGKELSRLWPRDESWRLKEHRLGWLSHLFVARREQVIL